MNSVASMPLGAFRNALAAGTATPSCGAATAISASHGLALVLMALRLSQADDDRQRPALVERGETLLEQLTRDADDDMQALERYISADADQDRQQSARDSTAVPLATARHCLDALRLADEALPQVRDNLRSDVHAGALLLQAALSAVLLNVDVNARQLRDAHDRGETARRRAQLQAEGDALLAAIHPVTRGDAVNPG